MKKKFFILSLICLLFITCACKISDTPSKTVDNFFVAIKNKDLKAMDDLCIDDLKVNNGNDSINNNFNIDIADIKSLLTAASFKPLVDMLLDFEYEIEEEQINNELGSVVVNIKAYNFFDIFSKIIKTVFANIDLFNLNQDDLLKKVKEAQDEILKNNDFKKDSISQGVVINLVYKDNKWFIDSLNNNMDLIYALLGNAQDFLNNITPFF